MGKIRYLLLSLGLVGFCLSAAAQSEAKVIQYADTFKLQDQPVAVNEESLIWTAFNLQHRNRALEDSIRVLLDSIARLHQEGVVPTPLLAALDSTEVDSVSRAVVDTIEYHYEEIAQLLAAEKRIDHAAIEPSIFRDLQEDMDDLNRSLHKRKYWSRELGGLVQFTQNYISPNWYKGGQSSFAMFMQVKGFYNYEKDNLIWENYLDWKVGVTTTGKTDTLRKFNVTDDQFRIQSKVGYQMVKTLYLAGSVELNTTLWNAWNSNQKTVKTAFMTPLKFYIHGGLDYRPVKDLKINFSPTVYKLIYACYDDPTLVNLGNFGLSDGQKLKSEFGSSIRVNYLWKPVREVRIDTELYLYTNYHHVEFDWEINCDFIINRFLSSRLTLHPRYATQEIADGDERAKLQFKELLSIGFSHKFR